MSKSLPIKTLPVLERWECKSCGRCCHGSLIWLDEEDERKLQDQAWDRHPDLAAVKTVVREGWFGGRRRLAQRDDGSCVFLLPDNRCRIHAEYGADAKPLICRMFPLQVVPLEKNAILTTRRSCPTAAADEGSELEHYRASVRQLVEAGKVPSSLSRPPEVVRGRGAAWPEFQLVSGTLERITCDTRLPLVRRIAHGLRFCALLEQSRLRKFDTAKLRELCEVLELTCTDVGDVFQDRKQPPQPGRILFRQIGAEYLRLHHAGEVEKGWRQRWRFARAAVAIARGRGTVPKIYGDLPPATFEELERPLGHLDESIQRPFLRYFETQAASKQYTIACRPGWSVVDAFRGLAIGYPIGLWLLRLLASGRTPTPKDAVDIVTILDRGQGYAPLRSVQHRARLTTLAKLDAFEQLVAWYAR